MKTILLKKLNLKKISYEIGDFKPKIIDKNHPPFLIKKLNEKF